MQHELRPLQSRCLRGLHRRTLRLARFGLTREAEGGRERREEGWREGGWGVFFSSRQLQPRRTGGGKALENFEKFG